MSPKRYVSASLMVCFLVSAALLLAVSTPARSGSNLSVGDFTKLIAFRVNPNDVTRKSMTWQDLTSEEAINILQKLRIKVPSSLSSPLTEQDVADLFQQFGITIQVQHPDSAFSQDRAEALVGIFGSTLSSSAGKIEHSLWKSQGGTRSSTSTLVTVETTGGCDADIQNCTAQDCQSLPRPPSGTCKPSDPQKICNPCMYCCQTDIRPPVQSPSPTGNNSNSFCSHLCQAHNLITTPTDPTP